MGAKKCIGILAGQYYDVETGLHYNYHRYYDPRTGRYLRADPIGLVGGINLFAYAQDNPLRYVDPYGLARGDWWDIRTYVSVSWSQTWMGEGTITSGGIEHETISPLTVSGTSIDISIGILPSPQDTVYEYGLGLGKHLGLGYFFDMPDSVGGSQIGGLTLHIGLGFGSPFFLSETLPDRNRRLSNLMDKELYLKECE